MVLEERGSMRNNIMLGRRVPHPASTQYDAGSPPAKRRRLKTFQSTDGEDDLSRTGSEDDKTPYSPRPLPDEIPDSEEDDGSDAEPAPPRRPTELESALLPIKTDKEAIAEYEAMKSQEDFDVEDVKSRIEKRSWARGKNSIYNDAFNLALETVLEDEGHLFDEKELEVFGQWRELEYEAQYLRVTPSQQEMSANVSRYVRLFLRKTSAWFRVNRLGYHGDISDIPVASKLLHSVRDLPESTAELQANPADVGPAEEEILGSTFTFADTSQDQIKTLDEALSLLNVEELKTLAKEAKVQGKNKAGLVKALREISQRQSGLSGQGWGSLKRSDSQAGSKSPTSDFDDETNESAEVSRDQHFLDKIMDITGPCIRLSMAALKLFERVHLVFYRSTEWTDKSLTTIILSRISRRNFPDYVVCRSTNIFPTRSDLLEFEAAIRTQFRVDNLLEFNGNPGRKGLEEVLAIFEEVYPRWQTILEEEQRKEDRVYESGEGAYLRRFSPAWVYTRIVHKGAECLGRVKRHEEEHAVLIKLLTQRLFHAARRGAWYQRKALLEEHYMADLQPLSGLTNAEQQKRHWKRISLQTCEEGLQDRECHTIFHHDLQKRIRKLERSMKIPKREQHDFDHVLLKKPTEIDVEGIQIQKDHLTSTTKRRRDGVVVERPRSTKTIWVDELEDDAECSVEAMCLSWYRSQGFKGYHAEGGIIRTLFAYLFYDILFIYIPNVFQTAYQTCPLDLHTDAFFPSRASEINHRLAEISNGHAARLIQEVHSQHSERKTCIIGLNWDFALPDLLEIAACFDDAALATICKVMAEEYRVRGGGIPDLFLWDAQKRVVRFSEVKSERDRLSDTQRLWIHVLTGAGIRVDLCNAVAREVRVVEVA